MKYRLTALSPLLVGDGHKLSPIDYMVWKDQVNVLDQRRIFKLLSKGPRLDGYLAQLKKSDKLDFASWGGFAQNFADRRVPFEDPSSSRYWERAAGESLHIPTFACGIAGPFVPGSAIKGALRTGALFAGLKPGSLQAIAQRMKEDRPPRRPAEQTEEQVLGASGHSRMRAIRVADSEPIAKTAFKIYLLRVSTLQKRAGAPGPAAVAPPTGDFTLGWKQSPRGVVDARKPEESTPSFAEMAVPGSIFEGDWQERAQRGRIFEAVNRYAEQLLTTQLQYAAWTRLERLTRNLESLRERLTSLRRDSACILSLGWGGGLLSKTAWIEGDQDDYHQILRTLPLYSRALGTGLPFPKTRRIVFENNQPSTLPGWALLELM
ncbi:MAG: type III-A CRISPR-associated RAMP protein Csm5 [Bryobacteraceae bacterium]